jgi:hypothetical protein
MSHHHDTPHYVRRVVLPSGKAIDVIYFEALREAEMTGPLPASTGIAMHVCGACASPLVYPVDWEEAGSTHWEVSLRCPECEWCGTGVFGQEAVERFDEELDRGTEALVRDLKRLVQAHMEEDVERFVTALQADHIVPEDF